MPPRRGTGAFACSLLHSAVERSYQLNLWAIVITANVNIYDKRNAQAPPSKSRARLLEKRADRGMDTCTVPIIDSICIIMSSLGQANNDVAITLQTTLTNTFDFIAS